MIYFCFTRIVQCLKYYLGISAGSILYVVVFEILQRQRNKSTTGILQLVFLILGFAALLLIENYGIGKMKP